MTRRGLLKLLGSLPLLKLWPGPAVTPELTTPRGWTTPRVWAPGEVLTAARVNEMWNETRIIEELQARR